ncbi:MAG: hypothetical protein RL131_974 [Bacteroidota bacterium]
MKFGVIGSGSWGTALAKILLDNGNEVIWCVRSQKIADHINQRHHNPAYLSSVYFDTSRLQVCIDPVEVFKTADHIILAVPSAYVDGYIQTAIPYFSREFSLVSAVKGLLPEKNLLLNHYLRDSIGVDESRYLAIMGPCHAEEVAAEKLSYLTFAGTDSQRVSLLASAFSNAYIQTVCSSDVNGVQYAAVLKNIYALGTGMASGLGYGDNFQSVLVANAAGEMKRFLQAVRDAGHEQINHAASVYLGDLLVTCYSLFSRNRSFGNMIGKGYRVEAAKLSMQMVAEGYPASKCIHEINRVKQVDLPIVETIYSILWEGEDAEMAFSQLEKKLI